MPCSHNSFIFNLFQFIKLKLKIKKSATRVDAITAAMIRDLKRNEFESLTHAFQDPYRHLKRCICRDYAVARYRIKLFSTSCTFW